MSDTEHTQPDDASDLATWRALRSLPRADLAPHALESQRAQLHAELARACAQTPRSGSWARPLESFWLCLCGACVLVRIALALILFVRAGT